MIAIAGEGIGRLRGIIWGGAAILLALPGIAMGLTDQMRWGAEDFAVLFLMLAAAGGVLDITVRHQQGRAYRLAMLVSLIGGFLLLWINLAVGVIGDEGNRANLIFALPIAIGVAGAMLGRLRAPAMAMTLLCTAGAQIGIAMWADALEIGSIWPITIGFVALWLLAAGLFHLAGRTAEPR